MKGFLYFSLLFTVVSCSRCGGDEPTPDPCRDIKPVKAEWNAFEPGVGLSVSDTLWDYSFSSDTMFSADWAFNAHCIDCEYEWTIGREIVKTKMFSRNRFPSDTPVPIKLKVKRKKDKNGCLLDNELVDSLKKTITNLSAYTKTKLSGRFFGYLNNNPEDTITLTLMPDSLVPGRPYKSITYNFVRNKLFVSFNEENIITHRQVQFGSSDGFYPLNDSVAVFIYGIGKIGQGGETNIRYYNVYYNYNTIKNKFKRSKPIKFEFKGHIISYNN